MNRLCGQHPVEGVFVLSRQKAGSHSVFHGNRKKAITYGGHPRNEILCQGTSEVELA